MKLIAKTTLERVRDNASRYSRFRAFATDDKQVQ